MLTILAFLLTIPAANWMVGHVGYCGGAGPCTVPVGFGFEAPSGVILIGLALALRDAIHERYSARVVFLAIMAGAALSVLVAPAALAIASGAAFLLSETADLLVYAPLRQQNRPLAVLASGLVGSVVDSAVFLSLAFGSLEYLIGQVLGKGWMTLAAAAVASLLGRRRAVE
ncbi:MAG: VUT family protein [Aestuariivirgaceae bacterium]|jgi:queuosine precursor transporter